MMVVSVEREDFISAAGLSDPIREYASKVVSQETTSAGVDPAARLGVLELDLRGHFIKVCNEAGAQVGNEDTSMMAVDSSPVEFWKETLRLCQHLVYFCETKKDTRYEGLAVRKLPILLLEDAADIMPASIASAFWSEAVEGAKDELLSDLMWHTNTACHLPFLKVCNKFLKVLDGQAGGRVLQLLAEGFGIAERSGMKVWGTFRAVDTAEFASESDFGEAQTAASSGVGYSVYKSFWSLQKDFSNPSAIHMADFVKKMRIVLSTLESTSQAYASRQQLKHKGETSMVNASTNNRFLTSPSLFHVQLLESGLRATFLTQFLIIATHLSSESASLRQALETLEKSAKQLLQKESSDYASLLQTILQKEDAWRSWKKQKCDPQRFAKEPQTAKAKSNRLSDGPLSTSNEENNNRMRLDPIKIEQLAEISRDMGEKIPTLDEHITKYAEAVDPDAGFEEAFHPRNNKLYCWRASRLLTKHHLSDFHLMNGTDFEQVVRYRFSEQGKPIPGTAEFKPEESIEEMLENAAKKKMDEDAGTGADGTGTGDGDGDVGEDAASDHGGRDGSDDNVDGKNDSNENDDGKDKDKDKDNEMDAVKASDDDDDDDDDDGDGAKDEKVVDQKDEINANAKKEDGMAIDNNTNKQAEDTGEDKGEEEDSGDKAKKGESQDATQGDVAVTKGSDETEKATSVSTTIKREDSKKPDPEGSEKDKTKASNDQKSLSKKRKASGQDEVPDEGKGKEDKGPAKKVKQEPADDSKDGKTESTKDKDGDRNRDTAKGKSKEDAAKSNQSEQIGARSAEQRKGTRSVAAFKSRGKAGQPSNDKPETGTRRSARNSNQTQTESGNRGRSQGKSNESAPRDQSAPRGRNRNQNDATGPKFGRDRDRKHPGPGSGSGPRGDSHRDGSGSGGGGGGGPRGGKNDRDDRGRWPRGEDMRDHRGGDRQTRSGGGGGGGGGGQRGERGDRGRNQGGGYRRGRRR